jgi:tetratricopeptide (TPR) repeat protein
MPTRNVKSKFAAGGVNAAALASHSERAGLPAWAVALLLALLIAAVYGPAINSPLIFDDAGAIVHNESTRTLWPLVGTTAPGPLNPPAELPTSARPLVNITFAINYCFGALNPAGYHAFNIVFHFLTAILLWAIVRRTLRLPYFDGRFDQTAEWWALAVTLLWSLHPLLTETVIYATQRTELMMALFYLATLYCSLRYWTAPSPAVAATHLDGKQASQRRGFSRMLWLALAVLACVCGMASKEVMVSAPLVVLLFERAFVAGSLAGALRHSWPLYIGLALTWIVLLVLNIGAPHRDAAGFHLGPPVYVWWFTQAKVFFIYLRLAAWPSPLLIHYQFPYLTSIADAWMYVVPLVLLGLATLVLLWRNSPLGFIATCVFAILAPTSVIPIVTEMAAERRMYLPLAALVVLFVLGGRKLAAAVFARRSMDSSNSYRYRASNLALALPVVLIALVFCVVSSRRLLAYDNELTLWLQVARAQPDDYMARQSIGAHFEKAGDDSAAIEQYREAARLNPDSWLAQYSLAVLLNKHGKHDEAAEHFAEAVRTLPQNAVLQNNLAFALYMAGRNEEAIDAFQAAVAVDPSYWPAYKNLGTALQKAGRSEAAVEAFENALRLNPKAIDIYNDLANVYAHMQQWPKAIAMLERGLALAQASGDLETAKKFTARLDVHRKPGASD